MYEYNPPRDRVSKVLTIVLAFGAAAFLIVSMNAATYRGIFQTCAAICAVAALLIGTRFVMTAYSYSVEYSDGRERSDGPDLVITEHRGKKAQVVCRVAVAGAKLEPDRRADGKKAPLAAEGKDHNYAAALFSDKDYWVYPTVADGAGRIRFSPDENIVAIFRRVNGESGAGNDAGENEN